MPIVKLRTAHYNSHSPRPQSTTAQDAAVVLVIGLCDLWMGDKLRDMDGWMHERPTVLY